jgi:hypothetical protein
MAVVRIAREFPKYRLKEVGGLWLISEKSKRYDFIHYLITVTVATKHCIFADMPPN